MSTTLCDLTDCSIPDKPVLHYIRLPCPSPTPGACSNSHPPSWLCHPTISSSVVPFSSCLHSFPASGSFPMSQFFDSSSQSIGASASASVLPMNVQDRFPLGLTNLIFLQSKGLSRVFSDTTVQNNYLALSLFMVQLSHPYIATGKTIVLTILIFKVLGLAHIFSFTLYQIRSVAQSYPILCDPMNCSTPGLPVYHQLLEFTQTHVH